MAENDEDRLDGMEIVKTMEIRRIKFFGHVIYKYYGGEEINGKRVRGRRRERYESGEHKKAIIIREKLSRNEKVNRHKREEWLRRSIWKKKKNIFLKT